VAESSTSRIEATRGFNEPDQPPLANRQKEKARPRLAKSQGTENSALDEPDDASEIEKHALDTMV
jgi:hypothetical protein